MMDTDKFPNYNCAYLKDKNIPVIAYRKTYRDFFRPKHNHCRGHFFFNENGLVKIYASDRTWIVTPKQTIWIPPYIEHHVVVCKEFSSVIIAVDESYSAPFGKDVQIFQISSLLIELKSKMMQSGSSYKKDSPSYRLARVLIDELLEMPKTKIHLSTGEDNRIRRVTDLLTNDNAHNYDNRYLSKVACMSTRNMERIFEKETGLTINEWRSQYKVLCAIEKLSSNESISSISIDLGYKSQSAFTSLFKKTVGYTPVELRKIMLSRV